MSVRGKSKHEWVALTLTDFGDKTRKEVLRHHFTVEAAYRAWDDLLKTYGRSWKPGERPRVWQETKDGETINDSVLY